MYSPEDNSVGSSTKSVEYKISRNDIKINPRKFQNRQNNFFIDDDKDEYDSFKKSIQRAIPSQNRYYCDDVYQFCKLCGENGHSKKYCTQQKSSQCVICLGTHQRHQCISVACFKCHEMGHIARFCKLKPNKIPNILNNNFKYFQELTCLNCNKKGHVNCSKIQYDDLYITK